MRPINRGEHPKNEDGSDFIPVKYQAYRGYLIDRIGAYCSYCERIMSHSIAVEHIQPKSLYDELEMDWSNLLLSCINCNSIKSSKDIIVTNYFWPNLDNTARAFIYSSAGTIRPNNNLGKALTRKALNTIELTGLDREPSEDLRKNPEVTDRRWIERRKAWEKANHAIQCLRENDTPAMRNIIIDLALATGFFSIWMTVFQGDVEMKRALVTTFKGTAINCYDESFNVIPRMHGSI